MKDPTIVTGKMDKEVEDDEDDSDITGDENEKKERNSVINNMKFEQVTWKNGSVLELYFKEMNEITSKTSLTLLLTLLQEITGINVIKIFPHLLIWIVKFPPNKEEI